MKVKKTIEKQQNSKRKLYYIVHNVRDNIVVKVKGTLPNLVKDSDPEEEVQKNSTDNLKGIAAGVGVMSAETSVIMDKNVFDYVVFTSYLSNKHPKNRESVSLLKSSTNNNKLDATEIDSVETGCGTELYIVKKT